MWSFRVESVTQARRVIRNSAIVFYAIAGVHVLLSFVFGVSVFIDGAVLGALGFWLHRAESRNAAALLIIASALTIVVTAVTLFTGRPGGRNIVVAVIAFWSALRAAVAVHKLPLLLKKPRVIVSTGQ